MPTAIERWRAPVRVNQILDGSQDQVKVFQLANGQFWVTWRDFADAGAGSQAGSDIFGQRHDVLGNPIGAITRLNNNYFESNENNGDFAVLGDRFFMVYRDTDIPGGYSDIILERKFSDGTPDGISDGVRVVAVDPTNDTSGINLFDAHIAIASATNAVVVYERRNGGLVDFVARFFNPTTFVLGAEVVVASPPGGQLNDVIALANGNYAMVWEQFTTSTLFDVGYKVFTQNGAQVSTQTFGSTTTSETQPAITQLVTGGILLAWSTTDAQGNPAITLEVLGDAGAPLTLPNRRASPVLAPTNDGAFVLAWTDPDGGSTFAQTFGSMFTFPFIGDRLQVGNMNTPDKSFTMLADGRVLLGFGGVDVYAAILDPRAAVNTTPVYTPESHQVGTSGNDAFTATAAVVYGWDGPDEITDGGGNNHIYGGLGGDRILVNDVSPSELVDGGTDVFSDTLVIVSLSGDGAFDLRAGTGQSNGLTQIMTGFERFESNVARNLTVSGTDGFNSILTGSGNDILVGRDGNDTLDGGAGDDLMSGDAGEDTVTYASATAGVTVTLASSSAQNTGGAGTDTITGVENLTGSPLNDVLTGDGAVNILSGSGGNDRLHGGGGDDRLAGGSGADFLDGGSGADVLDGETGDDQYVVDNVGDRILEFTGEGNDRVFTAISFTLDPTDSIEIFSTTDNGGLAAIDLTGNAFGQSIFGNDGANILRGGGGVDSLSGFGGDDFYFVDTDDLVYEVAGGGFDRLLSSTSYTLRAGAEVELFTTDDNFGTSAINFTGNEFGQSIFGNNGPNVLRGGGGQDSLSGFGGHDFYFVDSDDLVYEVAGGGTDRLLSSTSYTLRPDAEVEIFTTDDNLGTNPIDFTGNEFGQSIFGNNGPNTFVGGGGQDSLSGFGGNDFYFVDGDDLVYEAAAGGFDRLLSSTSYALRAGAEVELFTTNDNSGTSPIDFTGNEFGQSIFGNDGPNTLRGGGGLDSLSGFGGNDFYFVDGDDLVYEAAGGGFDRLLSSNSYFLRAGAEVELFTTDDNLGTSSIGFTGNEFAQSIYGNDGVNVLDGKGGADDLIGFGGADTFAFSSALGGGNVDVIYGFVSGQDRISLDRSVFGGLGLGSVPASAFVAGTSAQDADDRLLYDQATGRLFYDADGSGAGSAVLFATLTGGAILVANDFTVV